MWAGGHVATPLNKGALAIAGPAAAHVKPSKAAAREHAETNVNVCIMLQHLITSTQLYALAL
jgi:hypothetical protein